MIRTSPTPDAAATLPAHLTNIQVLRAFAALAVVFMHALGAGELYGVPAQVLSVFGKWGGGGVDVFFVISGFIMIFVQTRRARPPFAFALERLIRIVPLYWAATLALGLLFFIEPRLFMERQVTLPWLLTSLGFVSGPAGYQFPVIFVGWTLEYELMFYMIFAAALALPSLVWSTLAVFVALLAIVLGFGAEWIVMEFVMGMALGLVIVRQGLVRKGARLALWTGAALLFAGVFVRMWDPDFLGEHRVLTLGLPSLLMVYGAINTEQIRNRTLVLMGDASYSIYLLQIFGIPLVYKVAMLTPLRHIGGDALVILTLAATTLLSIASLKLFEQPVTRLLRRWATRASIPVRKGVERPAR